MNYELLETEITNRLAPFAMVGLSVRKMPELESEKIKPLPTKAQFTVMYAGSEYEGANSTAQVSQMETAFISVLIESTFLRGPLGIYALLATLKTALIGFKPTGCHRIQAVKHQTLGTPEAVKNANMWEYQAVFKTTSLTVENFTEDITILLKKITFIDVPGGEINIVPNPDNIVN